VIKNLPQDPATNIFKRKFEPKVILIPKFKDQYTGEFIHREPNLMIKKVKQDKENKKEDSQESSREEEEDELIVPAGAIPIPPEVFNFKIEDSSLTFEQSKREKLKEWADFLGEQSV
jgi:hypothetical protein